MASMVESIVACWFKVRLRVVGGALARGVMLRRVPNRKCDRVVAATAPSRWTRCDEGRLQAEVDTGSEYALWLAEESQSLEEAPVVGFGSEGGAQVVGCNIRDLLEILASDVEPMLDWDRVFYYVGDDHEASQGHDAYVEWLTDVLGRVPNRTADEVVLAAQQQYGARFDTWAKPYMP